MTKTTITMTIRLKQLCTYENNNTVFSEKAGTRSVQDDGLVVKGAYRLQDHIYIVIM